MEFLNKVLESSITKSIIAIIICVIVYGFLKRLLNRRLNKKSKKGKMPAIHVTYLKLFNNILKYVFMFIAILFILYFNGVNITSLVAGLGIVSAIVGLALQDALKDIIMGSNILTDNFFMVGDVIKYKDIEGKVLAIGLKNTKIEDIYTKDIISITNRNIDQIVNVSNFSYLNIPAPYEVSMEKVDNVLSTACQQIRNFENVIDCKYLGLKEFADSSLIYLIEINCPPEFKATIKRMALRCIKVLFDENNIEIPYTQIDIHTK